MQILFDPFDKNDKEHVKRLLYALDSINTMSFENRIINGECLKVLKDFPMELYIQIQ